jgi:hypothetical protein
VCVTRSVLNHWTKNVVLHINPFYTFVMTGRPVFFRRHAGTVTGPCIEDALISTDIFLNYVELLVHRAHLSCWTLGCVSLRACANRVLGGQHHQTKTKQPPDPADYTLCPLPPAARTDENFAPPLHG